jgi:hypothetical protein
MKTYRTSIYCIVAGEKPVWANTKTYGYVRVTNTPIPPEVTGTVNSWDVIHCAEGTEPPTNVVAIVVRGHNTPWNAEAVALGWPNGHPYVMEATWPEGDNIRRGKMIEVPEGKTPIETLLVPHEWAGDGLQ